MIWLALAVAAPTTTVHSGRLLGDDGAGISDTVSMRVDLYDATPTSLWHETHTVTLEDGYYSLVLGTQTPLDSAALLDATDIGLTIGTSDWKMPLHAAPVALATHGTLRLDETTQGTCDTVTEGNLQWTGDDLVFCDGARWVHLYSRHDGSSAAYATTSCKALHEAFPSLPSGGYWIDPDGGDTSDAYHLWCDMDNDGGGWTLVMSIKNGGPAGQPGGTGAYNVDLLDDGATPSGSAKIADADINLLGNEYRHTIHSLSTYERFYLLSHPFANAAGQVTTGDQCRTSVAASWVSVTGGASTHSIGLASTPPNDGCGTCADRCGGPASSGSWWSWSNYFPTSSNNGSYIQGQGYTGGWMFVR